MEQKWLKTLAALKSDDPRIYDDKTNFFDSEGLQLLINTLVTIFSVSYCERDFQTSSLKILMT